MQFRGLQLDVFDLPEANIEWISAENELAFFRNPIALSTDLACDAGNVKHACCDARWRRRREEIKQVCGTARAFRTRRCLETLH